MKEKNKQEIEKIRERKKENREKAKRIKEGNRRLIVPPKKTRRSLKMIHFDPKGVMHFEDGKWMAVFKVIKGMDELPEVVDRITSTARFTHYYGGKDEYFLTLIAEGDTYEDARVAFEKDEEVLKTWMEVSALSMEDVAKTMKKISGKGSPFSMNDWLKKRKDLAELTLPKVTEKKKSFSAKGMTGVSICLVWPPTDFSERFVQKIKDLSDEMIITFHLRKPTEKEKEDILSHRDEWYEEAGEDEKLPAFLYNECKIVLFWKDKENVKEKTHQVMDEMEKMDGFAIHDYKKQRQNALSAISLGILAEPHMRIEGSDFLYELFKKEYGDDKDKV